MNLKIFDSFPNKIPQAILFYGLDLSDVEDQVNSYLDSFENIKFVKPKIDELKNITHWINSKPLKQIKVIYIKDIESVSKEATNYLLKAIEDSPIYLKWVFYSNTKFLNKALLSRCFCSFISKEHDRVILRDFDQIKNFNDAYIWFVNTKEKSSDSELKENLLAFCDMLLQKQRNFDNIHLVQKYKNQINKESSGYENTFKALLTQVF